MQSHTTIVILASHNLVLEGIQRIVEQSEMPFQIGLATRSMEQLQRYCKKNPVDIAILVHFKIDLNVLKQINHLKTRNPELKVILVNMVHETHSVYRALQQGLDGYVTRGNIATELHQALSEVVAGKIPYLPEQVAKKIDKTEQENLKKKVSSQSYQTERKQSLAA